MIFIWALTSLKNEKEKTKMTITSNRTFDLDSVRAAQQSNFIRFLESGTRTRKSR